MMKFLLIAFSVFSSLFYLNNSLALANPNCSEPQTQLEMTFCAKQDFLAADEKLNRVYQKVFSKLSSPHKSALKKAQRAWLSLPGSCLSFLWFGRWRRDDAAHACEQLFGGGNRTAHQVTWTASAWKLVPPLLHNKVLRLQEKNNYFLHFLLQKYSFFRFFVPG